MLNGMKLLALVLLIFATACAHKPLGPVPVSSQWVATQLSGPVELKMNSDVDHVEKSAYIARSGSENYESGQLRGQKDETVDFVAQTTTLKVEPDKDRITQMITVTAKDGPGNLSDYAMPELGEQLETVINSHGVILKSGEYPPQSIFFVPQISLPDGPVQVGDTWTMQSDWLSPGESIPFHLEMVSILKGFYKCGSDDCADLGLSGEVTISGDLNRVIHFKSIWRGRTLFAVKSGTTVWSRINSEENFTAESVRRQVKSCIEDLLLEPKNLNLPGLTKPTCDEKVQY